MARSTSIIRTRFAAQFGIEHPLVCGGMTDVGTARLIAAVAHAGALGCLSAESAHARSLGARDLAGPRTDGPAFWRQSHDPADHQPGSV